MNHIYQITGMTCDGCKKSVEEHLAAVIGITDVDVNLETGEATLSMENHIPLEVLAKALPNKYKITEKKLGNIFSSSSDNHISETKIQQLKPLFLIFGYLFVSAYLLNYNDWNTSEAMLDFMGLFYIVFSFFKFLDLKGFPPTFSMYDPLAKRLPIYGWIYPFIELALGLMFLMRFKIDIALIITLVILGITTIGVTKTLLDKKAIKCACLGTALKLPMTEATFIENAIMIIMAVLMLLNIL